MSDKNLEISLLNKLLNVVNKIDALNVKTPSTDYSVWRQLTEYLRMTGDSIDLIEDLYLSVTSDGLWLFSIGNDGELSLSDNAAILKLVLLRAIKPSMFKYFLETGTMYHGEANALLTQSRKILINAIRGLIPPVHQPYLLSEYPSLIEPNAMYTMEIPLIKQLIAEYGEKDCNEEGHDTLSHNEPKQPLELIETDADNEKVKISLTAEDNYTQWILTIEPENTFCKNVVSLLLTAEAAMFVINYYEILNSVDISDGAIYANVSQQVNKNNNQDIAKNMITENAFISLMTSLNTPYYNLTDEEISLDDFHKLTTVVSIENQHPEEVILFGAKINIGVVYNDITDENTVVFSMADNVKLAYRLPLDEFSQWLSTQSR